MLSKLRVSMIVCCLICSFSVGQAFAGGTYCTTLYNLFCYGDCTTPGFVCQWTALPAGGNVCFCR